MHLLSKSILVLIISIIAFPTETQACRRATETLVRKMASRKALPAAATLLLRKRMPPHLLATGRRTPVRSAATCPPTPPSIETEEETIKHYELELWAPHFNNIMDLVTTFAQRSGHLHSSSPTTFPFGRCNPELAKPGLFLQDTVSQDFFRRILAFPVGGILLDQSVQPSDTTVEEIFEGTPYVPGKPRQLFINGPTFSPIPKTTKHTCYPLTVSDFPALPTMKDPDIEKFLNTLQMQAHLLHLKLYGQKPAEDES